VTSTAILKVGVGIINDAGLFWEDLRTDMKNLADAGLMTRLAYIDLHRDELFGPLALETAATEVLGITVDKEYQKSDWRGPPHAGHRICACSHFMDLRFSLMLVVDAALDAAISLRLYERTSVKLRDMEAEIGKPIPRDWYTFNTTLTEAMRVQRSIRNVELPWSTRDCTWFVSGKFHGTHF
jgi:hypothetical protein